MRTIVALGIVFGVVAAGGRAEAAPVIELSFNPFTDGRGLLQDGAQPGADQYGVFYVYNTGTTTLTVTNLAIQNPVAGIVFADPLCGDGTTTCSQTFPVAPNGAVGISVRCNAPASGTFTSSLVVTSDATSGSGTLPLPCKGFHPPVLSFTPAAGLDFGIAHDCWDGDACGPLCNTQPSQQTLTVTNTAPEPSEIDVSVVLPLSGANRSFDIVAALGDAFPLRAGESAGFTFTYHPRPPNQTDFESLTFTPSYPPGAMPTSVPFTAYGGSGQFQMDVVPTFSGPVGQTLYGTMTGHSSGDSCIELDSQSLLYSPAMTIVSPQIDMNHPRLLQAGEPIQWQLSCTPTQVAATCSNFELGWAHDDGFFIPANVCCRGDGGQLITDPSTIAFTFESSVPVGSSATRRVRVYNAGNQATDLVAMTSSHPQVTVALASGQLPVTLAPGAETPIDVTFAPTDTIYVSASIAFDGSNGDDTSLPVEGQGIVVAVAAVPPAHDYGAVALPAAPTQTFELRNTGDTALAVQAVTLDLPADFAIVGLAPGATVPAGGTLAFDVRATPSLLGQRRATLAIAFDHGVAVSVPLAVLASDPALVVATDDTDPDDAALAFGAVDVDVGPRIGHVHLHDAGTAPITIASCAITGDAAFTVSGGCPATIAAGGDADVAITFAPTAESDANAVLEITGAGFATGVLRIELHGIGLDQHVALSAMTLGFADTFRHPTAAATRIVTVTNTAATPLVLTAIAVDGDGFSLVGPSSATIATNASVDITVAFAPVAIAAYTGHLTIGNADDPAVAIVALNGRGIARDLAIGPLAIDLGTVTVGTSVRLGDRQPGAIAIHNADTAATFTIARIAWTGDPAVQLVEPAQRMLAPGETVTLDVVVTPTAAGPISGHITVYADGDPDPIADITVAAEAVPAPPTNGGCGCTSGDPAGLPLVLALLAFAFRRRRADR